MYYHTPKVSPYVEKVQKHRMKIILGYLFITVLSLFLYRPEFMTSDALFWLNESKEMQRTKLIISGDWSFLWIPLTRGSNRSLPSSRIGWSPWTGYVM